MTSFSWLCFLGCMLSMSAAAPIEKVMVDMSYVYDDTTQNSTYHKSFEMTVVHNGTFRDAGAWVRGEEIATFVHMGTHIDAPIHWFPTGLSVDQLPISHLIAPAAVINITEKAKQFDPEAEVAVEDLQNWERITGQSLNGTIVLMNSGWGKFWKNRTAYIGTPVEDSTKLRFPGFGREATQWLVDNRDIYGIGSDTISLDIGSSSSYPSHSIILGAGLFGLENVANVDKLPIYGAKLHVMPMKIGQASGAPTRIIATFPKIIFDHYANIS